jgi:hypothetical protein
MILQKEQNKQPVKESKEAQDHEIIEPEYELDISTESPQIPKIISAIKSLENGKAPGGDNLNAEPFNADPHLTATILQSIFQDIWKDITVPDEWNHGVIVKIPNKGNLNECNNWRGITLLYILSKIMATIIIRRISTAVGTKLRQEQAGFKPGKGCVDQIFTLRNIIKQYNE